MKKILFLALFSTLFMFDASAKGIIPFCASCEYVEIIEDINLGEEYLGENNETLKVGYFYKQVWVLWVPLWNYDGTYCMTNDAQDTIYDLEEGELEALQTANGGDLASNPISFWNKIGGKLVVVLLVVGFIVVKMRGRNEDVEVAHEQTAS